MTGPDQSVVVVVRPERAATTIVARGATEAALRDGVLVVTGASRPRVWTQWVAAAGALGVRARWVDCSPTASVVRERRLQAVVAQAALAVIGRDHLAEQDHWATLLGSTQVPVLLSGPVQDAFPPPRPPAVVLAVDTTEAWRSLLDVAAAEASRRGWPLLVLHASDHPLAAAEHSRERAWVGYPAALRPTGLGVPSSRLVLTCRHPADALLDHLQPHDLLVVAAHSPEGLHERLGGTNGFAEVGSAPCDVLLAQTGARAVRVAHRVAQRVSA